MGEILGKDQHGDIWVRKSSGGGCFTGLAFWLFVAFVVISAIVTIFGGLAAVIGNGVFSPYHVFTNNHNDAVRGAVRNFVGQGKYVGLFETDAGTEAYLSADDPHFSNVTLDPELGGFPGKAYTVDGATASNWFDFEKVGIQRQGHCLLTVYIQPTNDTSHTVKVMFNGTIANSYTENDNYTIHISPGSDNGSVDIGTGTADQYSYTVDIQADAGTPLEAIVIDRSGQGSSSTSASSSTSVASTHSTPQLTPTPAYMLNVPALYIGTIYQNQDGSSYDVRLAVNKQNADGSFEGNWYATINYAVEDVNVKGVVTPFSKSGQFSQIDSGKVQQLQQQDGESGMLLQFIGTSRDSGDNICVGCQYYGILATDGSVQGIFYWPVGSSQGDSSPAGTFQLTYT